MMRVLLAVLAAAFLYHTSAGAQTLSELRQKGRLVIGIVIDLPPFGQLDSGMKPIGLDIDVAQQIGRCLNLPIDLVQVTGANRIPLLLTGRVDLLASALAITPERAKQVLFSRPYVGLENVVIGPKNMKVASYADLAGHTVAVPRASTQEVALAEHAPAGARMLRYDDQATTVQALLSGQADMMGAPATILSQIEAAAPGQFEKKFELFVQRNAIAARLQVSELIVHVNNCLAAAETKGDLSAIYRRWFNADMPQL